VSVIGVGIDLVDLERIARMFRSKGEHAFGRLFTEQERAYLATRPDPTGNAAARIAAKEAVYKAMQSLPGARAIGWREIEVTRDEAGRPEIRLPPFLRRGVLPQRLFYHPLTTQGTCRSEANVDRRCPCCNLPCPTGVNCPFCSTKLTSAKLRRPLLWALVAEVYLALGVLVWTR
jgi:holo-[acyl-carrier protein] synthase